MDRLTTDFISKLRQKVDSKEESGREYSTLAVEAERLGFGGTSAKLKSIAHNEFNDYRRLRVMVELIGSTLKK